MREAGFVPNTNARQLKIQCAVAQLGVRGQHPANIFSDFLVQLQRAATLCGYNGIVSIWTRMPTRSTPLKRSCARIKPKAHDLPGRQRRKLPERICQHQRPFGAGYPRVGQADFSNLSMVGVDDRAAAYRAVSYLIQQGHRKIAVLGGPATSYPA